MKDMFQMIENLGDTFNSIRKHDSYFILDVKLKPEWVYEELVDKDKIAFKVNSQHETYNLISFYCEFDSDSVSYLYQSVMKIIKYNKDEEEKQNLLISKISELQNLFQSSSLEKLKNISFNTEEPFVKPKLNVTSNKKDNLVTKSIEKGPKRDNKEKEIINQEHSQG